MHANGSEVSYGEMSEYVMRPQLTLSFVFPTRSSHFDVFHVGCCCGDFPRLSAFVNAGMGALDASSGVPVIPGIEPPRGALVESAVMSYARNGGPGRGRR